MESQDKKEVMAKEIQAVFSKADFKGIMVFAISDLDDNGNALASGATSDSFQEQFVDEDGKNTFEGYCVAKQMGRSLADVLIDNQYVGEQIKQILGAQLFSGSNNPLNLLKKLAQ